MINVIGYYERLNIILGNWVADNKQADDFSSPPGLHGSSAFQGTELESCVKRAVTPAAL